MAVNLGMALDQAGADVCVVDLDLAFGDVAITMQLIPEHTIAEAADSEEHLDFAMLQTAAHPAPELGDDPGGADPPRGPRPDRRHPGARVIQTLRRNFDSSSSTRRPVSTTRSSGPSTRPTSASWSRRSTSPRSRTPRSPWRPSTCCSFPHNRHLVLNRADEEVGLSLANVEEILGMRSRSRCPAPRPSPAPPTTGSRSSCRKPDHPRLEGHHHAGPPGGR